MSAKVYTFHITYKEIPDKIWRDIQVSSNKTLADLGYTILSSFETLAYHLFVIEFNDKVYETTIEPEPGDYLMCEHKLSEFDLKIGDTLEMIYDFGTEQEFEIVLTGIEDMEKGHGKSYPKVIDGAGRGIIDDMSSEELLEIINETDKNGKSSFVTDYNRNEEYIYDYRDYDIRFDNTFIRAETLDIKDSYEIPPEEITNWL